MFLKLRFPDHNQALFAVSLESHGDALHPELRGDPAKLVREPPRRLRRAELEALTVRERGNNAARFIREPTG